MMYIKNLPKLLEGKNIEYAEERPLSAYTTFKIGGNARLIIFPKTVEQAVDVFDAIGSFGIKSLVLGNGSNVLVSDKGFDGAAVVLSSMKGYAVEGNIIYADVGVPLTRLASLAAENSLTGLEFAYGIPGSVGGGIFMNAGAYGGELGNVILSSRWYDTENGTIGEYSNIEHEFAYRHSVYMDESKIVLSSVIRLESGDKNEIVSKMEQYMSQRREKQPLEYPSAGSVFKRGNGFITAKLIEEAGLKGRRVGNAQVSEKHSGFIVNLGGASSDDVLRLVDIIKREVYEKFGREIECEIRYVG